MKQKIILSVITLIFIIISIQIISAEIIWSLPTGVEFTIVNSTTNQTDPLIITILNPTNKTYTIRNIPIEVKTNIESECFYSLDNGQLNSIGIGNYFLKKISIANGNHNIKIVCKSGDQEKIAIVYFKVNCPTKQRNNNALESDLEYENTLKTPVYGEWICNANQLQRTVTINNLQEIEYGQKCGFELRASEKTKKISIFWLLPLIFIILILIALVLIALIIVRK